MSAALCDNCAVPSTVLSPMDGFAELLVDVDTRKMDLVALSRLAAKAPRRPSRWCEACRRALAKLRSCGPRQMGRAA